MIIKFARLLAQKGLIFVPAASADEFEDFRMSSKLTCMVVRGDDGWPNMTSHL
jgi:hypothetical protein